MKHHIERFVAGLGWYAIGQDTTPDRYFEDVGKLRKFGAEGKYRLVRTQTIRTRTVVTSDYCEDEKE